ncbi:MAG TPA: pitrilysin family protein [Burkholderiaceae bacterium]|nr:pitrilysin family protein [Burkholderiaceae bacterium]
MDLRTRVLGNGLTIASVRLPGFRTAAIGAFVRVGSRDEPAGLNGISHFLEHMAFKGTETRDARRISLEIERVGATMNAYTAKDHTAYHTVLLAEHMPVALDVLADVIRRSTFPPEEIERERQVILQELGDAADDPESIAQDEFDLKAFPRQAFGRPILGNPRFVKSVTREDFLGYLGAHYVAGNMVVVGAGAIEHDRFADEVERRFGDLRAGTAAAREPARYVGGYRHVDDDYEQTSIALGWPVPARTDPAYPVYELLGELLGGGMSSPLFQSVREQRGLAYQIDAWTEGHDDCGMLQVTAGVAPRNLRVFFDVVCDELAGLGRRIAPEDLERTHNQQATHLARSLERPMELAETVARDLLVHGRVLSPDERIATAMAIGEDALAAAARDLLSRTPTLVLVGRAGRGDHHEAVRRRLAG